MQSSSSSLFFNEFQQEYFCVLQCDSNNEICRLTINLEIYALRCELTCTLLVLRKCEKDLKPTIVYFGDFGNIPPSTVFNIIFLNVGHSTFISVVKMPDKLIS